MVYSVIFSKIANSTIAYDRMKCRRYYSASLPRAL